MTHLHEEVALPEPAHKQLLHPIDIPQSRSLYRRGWWFARLCSLPVAVALGAVVWAATGSLFAALAAPIATFLIAHFASGFLSARAWDYIPRKRRSPDEAGPWRVLAALIDAMALLVTAGAVTVSALRTAVPNGVLMFGIGSAAGIALIQVGEIVAGLKRGQRGSMTATRLILLVAVVAAGALVVLFGRTEAPTPSSLGVAAAGAGTVLSAQAIWALTVRIRGVNVRRDDPS